MLFEKLSIKEKNIATIIGSGVFSVSNIAVYLNLYLRRRWLFSEYGTTDVMEILDR